MNFLFKEVNVMKKTKALLDFNKFSVAEKISFFRNVIDKLTNNPFFPNPDIPLTDKSPS